MDILTLDLERGFNMVDDINIKILYKMYLLECLFQDFDEKIDNPPMDYQLFIKMLKNV